jgi:hypothetical protein
MEYFPDPVKNKVAEINNMANAGVVASILSPFGK